MRILAVSQYYWPEPFNVADVCEGLVQRGHEVTVLTGIPNYPEGEVYSGYDKRRSLVEEHNGVVISRTAMAPRMHGPVNRVKNYYSFSRNGSKMARKLGPGYDVVLSFEISPVMSANPAIAYAEAFGAPLLLYVIDIWPECLLAGGIKKGSAVYNHYKRVSSTIYRSADVLAITSPSFGEYINNLASMNEEMLYLPQYAESVFDDLSVDDDLVDPSLFTADKAHFMFAGNVGRAQSVQTLIKAAAALQDEPIDIHIVGSGSELDSCKQLAQSLGANNVVFHGMHPIEHMPAYYARADAMVATFANNPTIGFTLPRKIQSYMAAGKPIIGTVTGEARRVIEDAQCGFCCEAEDVNGLACCIKKAAALESVERQELGRRAREYCDLHYAQADFFKNLQAQLATMKGAKHGDRFCVVQ